MSPGDVEVRRFRFGAFVLDLDRAALSRGGAEVRLRPQSFEVLRHLVERAGRLVTRDELMAQVWAGRVVTDGALTQCIADIRRALDDGGQQLVRTVARRGFVFEAAVERGPSGPPQAAAGEPGTPGSAGAPLASRLPLRKIASTAVALTAAALLWLVSDPMPQQVAPPTAAATTPAGRTGVAVLRFQDLSPDGEPGPLADGFAEEILHHLTQSPRLRVMAQGPGSAPASAVAGVARRSGAAHLLDGSVRREDDRLRVVVRLVDAASGAHTWSRTYDRTAGELLAVQRDIALDVARALEVALHPAAINASPHASEAHALYLRGRHLFHRRQPGDLDAAERHLRGALALDPSHARAWTTLAGVFHVRGIERSDPGHRLVEQAQALQEALKLDPALGEAHVRLARFAGSAGDLGARQAVITRAMRIAPDDPLVIAAKADAAFRAGRLDETVALYRRLVAIEPLSNVYRNLLGVWLLASGRPEEALRELRWALELGPDDAEVRAWQAKALLLLGRRDEALQASQGLAEGAERDLLRVLLDEGPATEAALRRLLQDTSADGQVRLAELAAHRGDLDAAWARLDAAIAQIRSAGDTDYPAYRAKTAAQASPFLQPLRADPRWRPWRSTCDDTGTEGAACRS